MNSRLLIIVASLVVVGTIVAGMWVTGSPATQRARRLDQERLTDLRQIERMINSYREREGRLPEDIEALTDDPNARFDKSDPETGAAYGYAAHEDGTYELCATFARPTEQRKPSRFNHDAPFWRHPAGRHCFTVDRRPAAER